MTTTKKAPVKDKAPVVELMPAITPPSNRATRRAKAKANVDARIVERKPLMTLDAAQRMGVVAAMQVLAQARQEAEKANGVLAQAEKTASEVFKALGLVPDKSYPIDEQGNVFPPQP